MHRACVAGRFFGGSVGERKPREAVCVLSEERAHFLCGYRHGHISVRSRMASVVQRDGDPGGRFPAVCRRLFLSACRRRQGRRLKRLSDSVLPLRPVSQKRGAAGFAERAYRGRVHGAARGRAGARPWRCRGPFEPRSDRGRRGDAIRAMDRILRKPSAREGDSGFCDLLCGTVRAVADHYGGR